MNISEKRKSLCRRSIKRGRISELGQRWQNLRDRERKRQNWSGSACNNEGYDQPTVVNNNDKNK